MNMVFTRKETKAMKIYDGYGEVCSVLLCEVLPVVHFSGQDSLLFDS